jgi:cysteine sulfinate desulfinase/cysteine desulfurase-like protein
MGIERDLALGGIRVGFGLGNDDADVDRLVLALDEIVASERRRRRA